jgi:hypothetical protein
MNKINNINLIKSFLSSSENHLIINQVNEEIGLFYIYATQVIALDQNLNVYISDEANTKNSSDLFGEIKIPIIKTNNTHHIKVILSSNKKIIIITDYKNFKKFAHEVKSINGYDHARDLKIFLNENLNIKDNNLFNYCVEMPIFTYSETSKFLVNKEKYFSDQMLQKEKNFIMEIRKAIFNLKNKNTNIKNLYNKIKEEFKYKKFNFLTY